MNSAADPSFASHNPKRRLSLAGEWDFALDPDNEGLAQKWFVPTVRGARLNDTIKLPGTTDERRKGLENKERNQGNLTRVHPYSGPA